MARPHKRLPLALVIATAIAWNTAACDAPRQAEPPTPVMLYTTISASGGGVLPNTLAGVSSATGAQWAVGRAGDTPEQASLARDPISGVLYGVNWFDKPGYLTRIDPSSGESTLLATAASLFAVALAPDGRMFGILTPRTLALVDAKGGPITPIGDIAGGLVILSIDFAADGSLYALMQDELPGGDNPQFLLTVDPATARVISSVFASNRYSMGDIACAPDGYVYATNYSWFLVRLDPRTGEQMLVGPGALGGLSGLAFAPEPSR